MTSTSSASSSSTLSSSTSTLSPSVIFNSMPGVPRPHSSPNIEDPTNPVVFLDIEIAGQPMGRLVFELFAHRLPRTAENFRQFCTGEMRGASSSGLGDAPIGYYHTSFHRLLSDVVIQGGDFVSSDGTGSFNIHGLAQPFADEGFFYAHDKAGLLSMANNGPDTNGCQFFITLGACPWLDQKHVCFGQLVEGMLTLRKMEAVSVGAANKPNLAITVSQCGEL